MTDDTLITRAIATLEPLCATDDQRIALSVLSGQITAAAGLGSDDAGTVREALAPIWSLLQDADTDIRPDLYHPARRAVEDLEQRLTRLTARVAALEAERAWRPIETAPRDGTRIVLYVSEYKEQFMASWMTSIEDGDGQWVISRSLGSAPVAFICRNPDYWRPLPPPPEGGR